MKQSESRELEVPTYKLCLWCSGCANHSYYIWGSGMVIYNRVMGELAVSRSIGDSPFKTGKAPLVLADPEVQSSHKTISSLCASGFYLDS